MTKWCANGKPFEFLAAVRSKRHLKEWEQDDVVPSHIHAEESKNSHKSRSSSRTTASESLHAVKDDGWNATREIPAPCRCPSLPQSSWQALGDTNEPRKPWTHTETEKKCSVLGTPGRASTSENPCSQFFHPVQFGILPKRSSLPYPDAEILSGYEEDVSSEAGFQLG